MRTSNPTCLYLDFSILLHYHQSSFSNIIPVLSCNNFILPLFYIYHYVFRPIRPSSGGHFLSCWLLHCYTLSHIYVVLSFPTKSLSKSIKFVKLIKFWICLVPVCAFVYVVYYIKSFHVKTAIMLEKEYLYII
jgi:hypothetical protein